MHQTHTPRPLAGPLRARINRLAHSQALQHEASLKASLLKQVQTARDDGASFDELAALVGKLETAPTEGVGGFKSLVHECGKPDGIRTAQTREIATGGD